tara:strand:+ start:13262 stop:13507 length:246 start_codon:yes stop_codon:yes gene_type:complete
MKRIEIVEDEDGGGKVGEFDVVEYLEVFDGSVWDGKCDVVEKFEDGEGKVWSLLERKSDKGRFIVREFEGDEDEEFVYCVK